MRRLETFDWWPELVGLKDTLSLRELATRFDVTPGAIAAALRRTATARRPSSPGPKRTARAPRPESPRPAPQPRPRGIDSVLATPALGRRHAWQVLYRTDVGDVPRVVIATSAVEAATIASDAADPVVGLSWVGEMLSD
jgi:hypothetical protein